jgi:hypothetical protein
MQCLMEILVVGKGSMNRRYLGGNAGLLKAAKLWDAFEGLDGGTVGGEGGAS